MKKISLLEPDAPALKPRKRVAAYARVSMETERLRHSLSAQVSHYSELIQNNPEWIYAGVYADDAVSGTGTERRNEFNRLIADCEAGLVNIVLVKSISRFSRNTVDLLETIRHLKDIGVDVWFEEEGIHSLDSDGELMLSILASFAQEESRSISENAKWGIRKGYEQGKRRNTVLYGYRVRNGAMVIDENEAAVVRRMFELFLAGDSCYMIAKKLNNEGVPSYYGKKWSNHVISCMLRQEKYIGNSLMQKFFTESHVTHKMVRNNGVLPMYYIEGTQPAIIDEGTFRRTQEEFATRYGVEIRNGAAEMATYMYHGQGRYNKPGFQFRKAQWSEEQRRAHGQMYKSRETFPYTRHELSLFVKCEACGENLVAKNYIFTDGTRDIRWYCHMHNRIAPDKPAPMHMRDGTLKKIICEVLGLEEFSEEIMERQLTYISALGTRLTFHFRDGHTEQRVYAHEKRKRCPRRY
mgnify:CR=1 FL=1